MNFWTNRRNILPKAARYLILFSTGLAMVFHVLAIFYTPYLNHDVAQYLTAGQMLIGGELPYVNIVDTNLPMIIYINAIPAAFALVAHIPLSTAGLIFLFTLVLITMILFGKMMKIVIPTLPGHQVYFIYTAWLSCSLWIYAHDDFGQREQLIFLFLAPFLLLRHARYIYLPVPRHLTIIISSLAFCGVAIKPFYLFPLLMVEVIHMFIYRRVLKPLLAVETFLCFCLGIAYLSHFYFIPGMSSFYNYWLGFMLRGYATYDTWNRMALFASLAHRKYVPVFIVLAIFLCVLVRYKKQSLLLMSACYGWFACGTLLLYIWQAKSWTYQLVPFFYGVFLGMALLFVALQERFSPKSWLILVRAVVALAVVAFSSPSLPSLVATPFQSAPFAFPKDAFVEVIEILTTSEDRVLFLNTVPPPAFPALTYSGRKHGGRFLCTYPLAFFFKQSSDYIPGEQWQEDEAKFYKFLEEDIHTIKPKVIFVNTRGHLPTMAPDFVIPEYLRRKGFYTMISSLYRPVGKVEGYDIYLLVE